MSNKEENLEKQLWDWISPDSIIAEIMDEVLEFLSDKKCLNEEGEKLRRKFWERYIKETRKNEQ